MQIGDRSVRNFYRYHEEILEALKRYAGKYGPVAGLRRRGRLGRRLRAFEPERGTCSACPIPTASTRWPRDAAAVVEEKFGAWNVYRRNGNQSMPTDTLHQLIRLRASGDPSLDDPRALLFVADLFHYFLGAPACCEHSLASYCRFYNVESGGWDEEILRAFGIPPAIRTKIVCAGGHNRLRECENPGTGRAGGRGADHRALFARHSLRRALGAGRGRTTGPSSAAVPGR